MCIITEMRVKNWPLAFRFTRPLNVIHWSHVRLSFSRVFRQSLVV